MNMPRITRSDISSCDIKINKQGPIMGQEHSIKPILVKQRDYFFVTG